MKKLEPKLKIGNYVLEKNIGRGGFGEVWLALNANEPNKKYAIKFELSESQSKVLSFEKDLLKELNDKSEGEIPKFYPKYYDYGEFCKMNYLVMELLGNNLKSYKQSKNRKILSDSDTGYIGMMMLDAIEDFHKKGFVHRDIKPQNFAFRISDDNSYSLCLIDFGLARKYVDENGSIIQNRARVGFRGTPKYASINSHKGEDLGRVDDLISFFYCLIDFCRPPLDWAKTTKKDIIKVLKESESFHLAPNQLKSIKEHLDSLSFASEPDYTFIREQLNNLYDEGGENSDNQRIYSNASICYPSIIQDSEFAEGFSLRQGQNTMPDTDAKAENVCCYI